MTHAQRSFVRHNVAPLRTLATAAAVVLVTACASPQKVDRMHSSLYHQQASLQQLEDDFLQLQQEREEVEAQLKQLEADNEARAEDIQQTRQQLQTLDGEQVQIQKVMRQMGADVATNTRSIEVMQSKDEKRQAIIREQQRRWEQITTQTNTKLAEIDQPQMNPGLEGQERDNAQP